MNVNDLKPQGRKIMPNETTEPEATKGREKEVKICGLTPNENIKGDAPPAKKDEKPGPRRTGEIDFMRGVIWQGKPAIDSKEHPVLPYTYATTRS